MSEATSLNDVHRIFLNFNKRAERSSADILAATFVDSEPLFDLLSTNNNQVIYGRRGTGKTHALKYLQEQVETNGEKAVYIDLRNVGSNGSIYGDDSKSLSERAGVLIIDVLAAVLDGLYDVAISVIEKVPNPDQITLRLDDLSSAISEVRVKGPVAVEETDATTETRERKANLELGLSKTPNLVASGAALDRNDVSSQRKLSRAGSVSVHIDFNRVGIALSGLIAVIGAPRLWLLIDEWSEVPIDLQPFLADLLRRTVITQQAITLKIAAIEHRSQFAIARERGEYTGLELGADVSADLNLDDFLVFDNNQERAVEFFKNLLFKHYHASDGSHQSIDAPDKLIQTTFTQVPVFEEFVRAVEGVPRDALNVMTKIVTRAFGQKIAMNHVRAAARDWYNQDKASIIRQNADLNALLARIIDEVIGKRKARAFLFESNIRDPRIEQLFDSRVLHVLKRNISSRDEPGTRYDVYKIDYGCYVELINTIKNPVGLFAENDQGGVEVPKDDYRSIRSAILRFWNDNVDEAFGI